MQWPGPGSGKRPTTCSADPRREQPTQRVCSTGEFKVEGCWSVTTQCALGQELKGPALAQCPHFSSTDAVVKGAGSGVRQPGFES